MRTSGIAPPAAVDACRRWLDAIHAVVMAPHDPRTLSEWGALIGVSPSAIRAWCQRLRIGSKPSLDLARVLRSIRLSRRCGCPPSCFLDVAQQRTLYRLLRRAGIPNEKDVVSFAFVLDNQAFITCPVAVAAVRSLFTEIDGALHMSESTSESGCSS